MSILKQALDLSGVIDKNETAKQVNEVIDTLDLHSKEGTAVGKNLGVLLSATKFAHHLGTFKALFIVILNLALYNNIPNHLLAISLAVLIDFLFLRSMKSVQERFMVVCMAWTTDFTLGRFDMEGNSVKTYTKLIRK
jgi:hypothetical protein